MDDSVSLCIGNTGKWQIRTGILLTLLKFSLGWNNYMMVFYSPPQKFWCRNTRVHVNQNDLLLENRCLTVKSDHNEDRTFLVKSPCTNFTYDTSVYSSTIVSEWNLVCKDAFLVELSQIAVLVGFTIGSVIFGYMADKCGRRKPLVACIIVNIVGQFCITYSPTFIGFLIARTIVSLASGGIGVISFVLCTEVFGGKWRAIISSLFQLPFTLSLVILTLLSYYLRDWRDLQASISYLSLIYLPHILLIPESPRWLLAKQRRTQLIDMLEDVAKMNGKNVDNINNIIMSENVQSVNTDKYRYLLKKHIFEKKTFLLGILWFSQGLCIYGVALNFGNISSNLFIITGFSSLGSTMGILLSTILAQYMTRRTELASAYSATAFSLLFMLLIPNGEYTYDWPRILLSFITVSSLAIATPLLFIYTGELYPTLIRNSLIGSATLLTKVGGCLSPLLLTIGRISNFIPWTIMATLALLMAVCLYFLPETKGSNLVKEDFNKNKCNTYEKVNMEETIN